MPSTLTSFTPGDLVISVYGDGDGSSSGYTLDQAAPITLYELTTTGVVQGQLVLPETTTVVNGTTEYAISGEYGAASEGTLELSADGQSLTIVGYGVNDVAFDTKGASLYGAAALGQSSSVAGGPYIAVPRVVADIGYNGAVDASTALYDIYSTNNPRSAATVNGSTFYLSGQSVKGSNTQGVFTATDGSTAATAIDTSTDTRTAEIYNGQLYVSRDSAQSATSGTNIASYGASLPAGATTPVVLTGISQSVTLTASQQNSVNAGAVGASVNLSPENFFFADPNTLYVADAGVPKEGGIGDGGLQKWSFNGSTWALDYTLSLGLNPVANTASTGVTGLYGLTGVVSGGSVELYATTSTVGELDPSFLYGITDMLSATSLPAAESFTQLMAAAPDTLIRGVSFAPAAATVAPVSTIVSAGVTSSGLTVSSGSVLTVQSGGIVSGTTILSGGTADVSGTDSGGIVAHGGTETVLGAASGDQVGGTQLVSAATAVVNNETVENGGIVELFLKGAAANGLTVMSGGSLVISGNATAENTVISGGVVVLESPKAVLGGSLDFAGPGTLKTTVVASSSFGDQAVISGFGMGDVIDLTTVGAGATLATAVVSGNTVATVGSLGVTQTFAFAGSTISLALASDGSVGTDITFVPPPTTSVTVSSGVTSSGLVVTSGSTLTVNGGGTVVSATILSGGAATVAGLDSGSVISAGGNETVLGSAVGDQVFGTQLISAGGAVVSGETVFNGGSVDLFLKGGAVDNLTVSSGGALNINGNATGSNTVVAGGGVIDLQSPKANLTGTLTFSGAGTLLVTDQTSAGFGDLAPILGFGAGDSVDVAVIAPGAALASTVVSGNTVETVSGGGASQSFIFAGLYAPNSFSLVADAGAGVMIVAAATPCYCPGTLILTDQGEVAIETLAIGDRVITVAGAAEPIRWIGRRSYAGRFLAARRQALPVLIRAGALGGGLPRRDLRVSPLHAMLLDGMLVPAGALVNGSTIVQEIQCRHVDYIHVELSRHDVIWAEGAPSETFLDDDSRGMFQNAAEHGALYPDSERAAAFCAPRVESGFALEAIRRRLAQVEAAAA